LLLMRRLPRSTRKESSAASECIRDSPITDSLSAPTIDPPSDALVAIGSSDNVTYNCRADEDAILWELNGRQIQGQMTITMYRNAHIFVEDQSEEDMSSTLTVTLEGRQILGSDPVSVLCLTFSEADFYTSRGETFNIIQFGEGLFSFCDRLQCFGYREY